MCIYPKRIRKESIPAIIKSVHNKIYENEINIFQAHYFIIIVATNITRGLCSILLIADTGIVHGIDNSILVVHPILWHHHGSIDVHIILRHHGLVHLLFRHIEHHVTVIAIEIAVGIRGRLDVFVNDRRLEGHIGDIDVLVDNTAIDVEFQLFVHPMLEELHRRSVAAAHAAAAFALLASATASILAGVEVGAAEVGGGVVVGAVGLAAAAGLAVGEELAIVGGVLADPNLADLAVVTFDVATEFVVAVEALRLIFTELAKRRLTG